eukprot:11467139-Ditylum_brightwellii.AAC.1
MPHFNKCLDDVAELLNTLLTRREDADAMAVWTQLQLQILGLRLTYAYVRCPNDDADYTFWLVHLVYGLRTRVYVAPMMMQHAFAGIEATWELG